MPPQGEQTAMRSNWRYVMVALWMVAVLAVYLRALAQAALG